MTSAERKAELLIFLRSSVATARLCANSADCAARRSRKHAHAIRGAQALALAAAGALEKVRAKVEATR